LELTKSAQDHVFFIFIFLYIVYSWTNIVSITQFSNDNSNSYVTICCMLRLSCNLQALVHRRLIEIIVFILLENLHMRSVHYRSQFECYQSRSCSIWPSLSTSILTILLIVLAIWITLLVYFLIIVTREWSHTIKQGKR